MHTSHSTRPTGVLEWLFAFDLLRLPPFIAAASGMAKSRKSNARALTKSPSGKTASDSPSERTLSREDLALLKQSLEEAARLSNLRFGEFSSLADEASAIQQLVTELRNRLQDVAHYESADVFLLNPLDNELVHFFSTDFSQRADSRPLFSVPISASVVCSAPHSPTYFYEAVGRTTNSFERESTLSAIALSLVHKGRIIGVLNCESTKELSCDGGAIELLLHTAADLTEALSSFNAASKRFSLNRLAKTPSFMPTLFGSMTDEKVVLSPERARLAELVRSLSTSLLGDKANTTWLLENFPEECRAIALTFSQYDEAAAADSSQAATLLGKKRAASLTSEHQRKAATARSAKLSAEERSDIAKAAAAKRWNKETDGK